MLAVPSVPTRRIRHSTAASGSMSLITNFLISPSTIFVTVLPPLILYSISYLSISSTPYSFAVVSKEFQSRVRADPLLYFTLLLMARYFGFSVTQSLQILSAGTGFPSTVFVPTRRIRHSTVESGAIPLRVNVFGLSTSFVCRKVSPPLTLYSISYFVTFSTPYCAAVWAKSFQARVRVFSSYVCDI